MKIECDKCAAKYSIADEKVRGKTFKIRCKKCSNVIIVRDAQEQADAPEPEEPAAVGWHLAIDGETVGPLSEEDVRQRYDDGEIDKETAIWQEGFEDWIGLGEADAFADLPDREEPAASEEDPFSRAHEEDYSAGREAALGASLGAAMPESAEAAPLAAVAAAESLPDDDPRVSSLTGQRNENSVLFSLDNLQAMATAGGGGAIAAAPKSLATAAPSSEGSGLIDIRSMGSTLGGGGGGGGLGGGGGAAPGVDEALPSFGGGGGFGGLAATPLVAQPADGEAATGKRSGSLLYAMVGVVVLLLGAVGFLAYIVLTKEPEVKVVKEQAAAPVMKDAKDKKNDEDDAKKDDEGEDEGTGQGDTGAGTGESQAGMAGSGSSGSKRKSSKKKKSSGGGSSGGSTPAEPSGGGGAPSGSSSGGSEMDVDCILNPNLPKCKKGKKKKPKPSGGGSSGANLPEKLTITQVKSGMSKVKPAAKSCGLRHGAKGGEKVKVKVSISGSSGRVVSAAPQGPHAGKPLGNCVAAAAKKASFPKFKKAQMGVVYPFTM